MSVWIDPECGRIVARIVGNETTVLDKIAAEIQARAVALSASHTITGEWASAFSVERVPGESGVMDREVSNSHPWAASIELGHFNARTGRPTAGLHLLRKAAHG